MKADNFSRRAVRAYPTRWSARYGNELEELIAATSERGRVSWKVVLDVLFGAVREWAREFGLGPDASPPERLRGVVQVVLSAWALFVVGGLMLQKTSEHWQAAPSANAAVAGPAFTTVMISAMLASATIVVGVLVALPTIVRFARGGGGAALRSAITGPALASTLFVIGAALVVWQASQLNAHQRNGGDAAYEFLVTGAALLGVLMLFSWTRAGTRIARQLRFSAAILRAEASLACAVALLMVITALATAVWWTALSDRTQMFLTGSGSGVSVQGVIVVMTMFPAATIATFAAIGAMRDLAGRKR